MKEYKALLVWSWKLRQKNINIRWWFLILEQYIRFWLTMRSFLTCRIRIRSYPFSERGNLAWKGDITLESYIAHMLRNTMSWLVEIAGKCSLLKFKEFYLKKKRKIMDFQTLKFSKFPKPRKACTFKHMKISTSWAFNNPNQYPKMLYFWELSIRLKNFSLKY